MAKAYVIADIDVTDTVAYEDYKRLSTQAAELYGARFLVRGGALRFGWTFPRYRSRPGRRPEDIL